MTLDLLADALSICRLTGRADFRLVFNSRGAFASVNHFHYHALYMQNCGMESTAGSLPIDLVERETVSDDGNVHIQRLRETQYFVRAVTFSADFSKKDFLCKAVWKFVKHCQDLDIPHNLVARPILNDCGTPTSVELVVIPRRQQRHHDVKAAGYNAAIMEMCGMIVCQSQEMYDTLTEEKLFASMTGGVCLPLAEFE